MGVQLDWKIESDQRTRGSGQHNEDPQAGRRRRRQLWRVVLTIAVLLSLVGVVILFVQERLRQADERDRTQLENTVRAEITALNVGEQTTFASIQRSATEDWLRVQADAYLDYQNDKALTDRVLTGRVLGVTVDGTRGRVQVEEIENGTPYVVTWFYWNYEAIRDAKGEVMEAGGWHHVAPDYTFWGEPRDTQREHFALRYQTLDTPVAQAMEAALSRWYNVLCASLDCGRVPFLTVDIVADPSAGIAWTDETNWQLLVSSPNSGRARYDQPFSGDLEQGVAAALAEQAVSTYTLSPDPRSDAGFFIESTRRWLLGQWLQVDTGAYLLGSLVQQNGSGTISRLLIALRSGSDVSVLGTALSLDLARAELDWRDFIDWRLQIERDVILAGDQEALFQLYDTRTEVIQQIAAGRLSLLPVSQTAVSVTRQTASDGTPQLTAMLNDGTSVAFSLVNGNWLRAS